MPTARLDFDWAELAFDSKKPLRELQAIFLAAPREISTKRFIEIVKAYLPKANVVIGIAKEPYVLGLEERPQFAMLRAEAIQAIVAKVNAASPKHKLYTLHYSQRDAAYMYEKIPFKEVLLINGSWYHGFHHRPEYYVLVRMGIPFTKLSPFSSEREARVYAEEVAFPKLPSSGTFNEAEMMDLAEQAAQRSYDYAGLQTGGVIGRKKGAKYELLATGHNRIVPYETYAMHAGSEREQHFSPVNDLNYYDTIHYEVALLLASLRNGIDVSGAAIFETVLSCPHCARMLAASNIAEVVYREDHSSGYAVKMLEMAGKKVRRLVSDHDMNKELV